MFVLPQFVLALKSLFRPFHFSRTGTTISTREPSCLLEFFVRNLPLLLTFLITTASAHGADGDRRGLDFFEAKIRPELVTHCYECHSAGAAGKNKLKGGLLLDSRDGSRKGGESGPAVVPGKPEESLLLSALTHDSFKMPPKGKLPDELIGHFRKWIEMGAPDPRDGEAVVA